MDLTPLFQAFIGLLATLITVFIIPYIRSKFKNKELFDLIEKTVKAAEQLAKAYGWDGEAKKNYVISCLKAKGYTIDIDNITDTINALIEGTVYEIKQDK